VAKIALVTGGTRGIGAAISLALKNKGYKVAANYAGNDERAKSFSESSGIPIYKFDVSDFKQVDEGIKRINDDMGGSIDILVNNAGITRDSTLHRMDPESWQKVLDTNLGSCYNTSRAVIESMREREFGRIVNVGSINGQAGQYGQVNYAAAKSGIHGFTKALAQEGAAKGITVNAIAPAEDIARCVVFLVADDAGFITGSTLSVNGGQHMY
jgi:acetoacetyl-CoA reductase